MEDIRGHRGRSTVLFIAIVALALASVFATSVSPALAQDTCPNEQLRAANNSLGLPNCRAYELVTPNLTNSQGNTFSLKGNAASSDGSALITSSETELPGSPVGGSGAEVSRRTGSGWISAPIEPGNDEPTNVHSTVLGAAGSDFSTIFLGDDSQLVPGDSDELINDVFAVGASGSLAWISQGSDGGVGAGHESDTQSGTELTDAVGGATSSLSHVVFETPMGSLLSEDSHEYGAEIYDRVDQSSTKLVGILPGGGVPTCGASLGNQRDGTSIELTTGYLNSVSQAGSTVFFQSPDPLSREPIRARPGLTPCPENDFTPPQLYVRLDDDRTLDASAPDPGVVDAHGEQEARYDGATPDGSATVFTDKGSLTSDANTAGDAVEDLYEYEPNSETLTDLSSEGLRDPNGAQVDGVVGISDNGAAVYFVAKGQLAPQATEGGENLYVATDGHVDYIVTLSRTDEADWLRTVQKRAARVSPDGNHLLFTSSKSLPGYPTGGRSELYLYKLGAPVLTCVSCGGPGRAPQGEVGPLTEIDGSVARAFATSSDLSDDGATVFFESTDALAESSVLGKPNVYEWHNLTTALLAPDASLMFVTPSGDDVFVKTFDSLTPQDEDGGELDFYDVRVGGGFPVLSSAAPECESNESCKGPGSFPGRPYPSSVQAVSSPRLPLAVPPVAQKPALKSLTRLQKLAAALKSCRSTPKKRRAVCIASARKRFGQRRASKRTSRNGDVMSTPIARKGSR